jgi:hypothetical protein
MHRNISALQTLTAAFVFALIAAKRIVFEAFAASATQPANAARPRDDILVTIRSGRPISFAVVELRHLTVLHWRGEHVPSIAAVPQDCGAEAFHINTCQRRVSIAAHRAALQQMSQLMPADGALQSFTGVEAYSFLLRLACGLESRMVAETQIFGQIKQAWHDYCESSPPTLADLSPWMQRLFQDTKDIRSRFLMGAGSSCYGSQVRRLLATTGSGGSTLLLGAGQLAQTVAPWIESSEVWLCNRRVERAHELASQMRARHPERVYRVIDGDIDSELHAWMRASNVVICVPAHSEHDARRAAAWRSRGGNGQLIHLGADARNAAVWSQLAGFTSLQDIFKTQHLQSNQKLRQIQNARHACAEKALLRSLNSNGTQILSWEDLAAFATLD